MFPSCFCFDLFLPDCNLGSEVAMSSSGPPKDSFFANIMNPYMNELKMHPKELVLKDGKVQAEDVQGPAGEGSQEERMKKLEFLPLHKKQENRTMSR